MTRFTLVIGFLALAGVLGGPDIAAGPSRSDGDSLAFAVKAAQIYAVDSDAVLADAWMEVADGRIVRIATGPIPSDLDVVDLGDAIVVPGLVSMNARSLGMSDTRRQGAVAVSGDNFDLHAHHDSVWRHGITTARLAVPESAFIGGIASVARIGGPERNEIVHREIDLSISFADAGGRNAPLAGEVSFPSSSDVPLQVGRVIRPETRLGRVAAFKDLLEEVKVHAASVAGSARTAAPYSARLESLMNILKSDRPIRLEARRAVDIRQALNALESSGRRGYIYGGEEAALVLSLLKGRSVPVVLEFPTDQPPAGFDQISGSESWTLAADRAGQVHRAGIHLAVAASNDNLLLAAAMAAGQGGLTRHAALKAVTLWPAEMLGIADRCGSLTPGKEADFVVLNGDPISGGTRVLETWVRGRKVWSHSKNEPSALLVRAGRVYDGLGNVHENGEVLVEDGLVVAAGSRVPRPPNVQVIDAGRNAVVTPGFVDTHGHIGTYGERTRPTATVGFAEAIKVPRREFRHLALAGLTTVVVASRDADANGSVMVAVKTDAMRVGEVVRDAEAAIKLAAAASGDATEKTFDGLFKRAKAYDDQWRKYEEEYAKWKAQGAPASAPANAEAKPAETKSEEAAKDDPVTGTWKATLKGPMLPEPEEGILKLRLNDDNTITGTTSSPVGGSDEEVGVRGKLDGKTVTLEILLPAGPTPLPISNPKLTATLDGPDHMIGKVDVGGLLTLDFEAVRTEKGAPVIKVQRTRKTEAVAGPKKPKLEPTLEPYRRLFAGQCGLLVVSPNAAACSGALKVLESYKIQPIFVPTGLVNREYLEAIAGRAVIALEPSRLQGVDRRRTIFVPYECAKRGIPVVYHSSAELAAAGLATRIRLAVANGLGADEALISLTSGAAKALNLDDKVGSFKRGCDGDLLIFDGEPFDAATRLMRVFVRGREVKQ